MPAHHHNVELAFGANDPANGLGYHTAGVGQRDFDFIKNTGGNGAHNNMSPYLSVYMWKRTS